MSSLPLNPLEITLKANKGSTVVILDKYDYIRKMLDHLHNSGSYKKLNKNHLKKGGERLIDIKIIQLYIQARGRRRG